MASNTYRTLCLCWLRSAVNGTPTDGLVRATVDALCAETAGGTEPEDPPALPVAEPNADTDSAAPEAEERPAVPQRGSRAKSAKWHAAMANLGEEKRRKRQEAAAAADAERAAAELLQTSVQQANESPELQEASARAVQAKKPQPAADSEAPAGDVTEALRMAREMVAAELEGGLKEGGGPIALRVSRACNISVMTAGDLVEEAVRARNEARVGRRNAA